MSITMVVGVSPELTVLVTGRYIGEGSDDVRLETLFLALPVSWRGTLVQYTGRLHRLRTEVLGHLVSALPQANAHAHRFAVTDPLLTVAGYFTLRNPDSCLAGIALAGRPLTMLIDRDGPVRNRIIRYSYEEFETAVKELL